MDPPNYPQPLAHQAIPAEEPSMSNSTQTAE